MGAELLFAALPAAAITDERRQRLHQIVDRLTDKDLGAFDPDDWDAEGPDDIRRKLHGHVAALHGPDQRRDVAVLDVPGLPYPLWLTGGMSWGDDPNHIYEGFCLLAECLAVYSQLEKWARADAESESND